MSLFILSACTGQEKFEKGEIAIEGWGKRVTLNVEFARTPAQQQQGLMHRKELKDGSGMLFIFDRDEVLSFWMKNTVIPLSIAYIDSTGKILEIHNLEPRNLNPVRSSLPARYALEVPRGWFARSGLDAGYRLDLKGL